MRDDNNSAEKSKKKYGFVERILLLLPQQYFLYLHLLYICQVPYS